MIYYFIILLSSTIFCSTNVDVVQEDNIKIVQVGEDVKLTCTCPSVLDLKTAWFKQTADGKSVRIVYGSYFIKDYEPKNNRFKVTRGNINSCFNLTIVKTELSDSAIYYCVVSGYQTFGMGSGTRLFVRDTAADRHPTLQQSLIETFHPGASVNLQCSLLTESCAGDHSVYWILNIIFFTYAVFVTIKLCDKVHKSHENQGEDIMRYAAQNYLIAEGSEVKMTEGYTFVKYSMFTPTDNKML